MIKYIVYRSNVQPAQWDQVEFNLGWITCFNENDPNSIIYYPAHSIDYISKVEEAPLPERRLSWNDLERLN